MNNQYFSLQKFEINGYSPSFSDLKMITIFNDIDNLGMTLKVLFNDTTDIITKMPVKGFEDIHVIFIDEYNNKFDKTFSCTSWKELNKTSEQDVIVELKGISKDSFIFSQKKIYRSYQKSITDIITDISSSKISSTNNNEIQFVSPGWSVTKCLQYLSGMNGSLYFERNMDGFLFEELDDILNIEKEKLNSENVYKINSNNPHYRYLVKSFREVDMGNLMKDLCSGIYGNTSLAYDPNLKQVKSKVTTLPEVMDDYLTLGSGSPYVKDIDDILEENLKYVPYSSDTILNDSSTWKSRIHTWNKVLEIVTPGDVTKEIGTLIKLSMKDRFNTNPNPKLHGIYLVTKTAWNLTHTDFSCKMRIEKNSWNKGDELVKNVLI